MMTRNNKALAWILMLPLASACGASQRRGLGGQDSIQGSEAAPSAGTLAKESIRLAQDPTLCLDVTDNAKTSGTKMQLWTCHEQSNQTFDIDEFGLIHVFSSLCLRAGALDEQVTLAACSAEDGQQVWLIRGSTVVTAGSGQCLNAKISESLTTGTAVTTTTCIASDSTQTWVLGSAADPTEEVPAEQGNTSPVEEDSSQDDTGEATSPEQPSPAPEVLAEGAAKVLTTQAAASMADLAAKSPTRLAAQIQNIQAAALSYNVQPQLLVAIAMAESTGGSDQAAYSNGGGMFQFTNEDTWRAYGTKNTQDRQNDALSAKASAKYMAALLNNHNGSLSAALREYNGPLSQGGNPNYIPSIYSKMLGNF